jgi:hypothetical protein
MLTTFSSCFEESEDLPSVTSDDARIVAFSLKNDSIPGLASTVFSIDHNGILVGSQTKGLIYNQDSLAFGSDLNFGGIVTFVLGDNTGGGVVRIEGTDSIWITSTKDTLHIANQVELLTYSPTNEKSRSYIVKVNVHTVDPDTFIAKKESGPHAFLTATAPKTFSFKDSVYSLEQNLSLKQFRKTKDMTAWTPFSALGIPLSEQVVSFVASNEYVFAHTDAQNIYMSSDILSWTKLNLEYPVVSLLGYMEEGVIQPSGLSCIIEKDGENKFGFYSELTEWDENMSVVPTGFPVQDFSVITYTKHHTNRISLIGGLDKNSSPLNTIWSTENGYSWTKLNNSVQETQFPKLYGANSFIYDGEIHIMNGRLTSGEYNDQVYYSIDEGNTWLLKESKYAFPESYVLREGASLIVDEEGIYFYIIGGSQTGTDQQDIWKMFRMGNSFINRK